VGEADRCDEECASVAQRVHLMSQGLLLRVRAASGDLQEGPAEDVLPEAAEEIQPARENDGTVLHGHR